MENILHHSQGVVLVLAGVLVSIVVSQPIQADIFDPTNLWNTVSYASPNQFDYSDDQQTGNRDSDIVGNAGHAAFYTQFDNLGTADLTDGIWSARVRLGSDRPQTGTFDNNLFVGIDANNDGVLDLLLGVDNQGSNTRLAIWDPGNGGNYSPSSTSIVSPAAYYIDQTISTYDFAAVTTTNDPTATLLDIDNDGDNDQFLSFSLDFAEIVNQMNLIAGISINEYSSMSMVLATANNDNSLNQDLNGADGGVGSDSTWADLGVMSNVTSFNPVGVPEPGSAVVLVLLFSAALGCNRRRTGV